MDPKTLVCSLALRDIQIWARGDRLVVNPASLLTDKERQLIRACKAELLRLLSPATAPPSADSVRATQKHEQADIPRIARLDQEHIARDPIPLSYAEFKAMELIKTCREFGVGLRLDPDGSLVIESNGKGWRALVEDITANAEEVAKLVLTGWNSNDA